MRKQISHSKLTLRFLVLAVALALAGCAVLTVDVDMYKGPLANDETVIVEQIKAEIIGAKSLLFTLRNTLEEGSNGCRPYLKKYEFMPMPPDPNKRKKEWLRNNDAIRVNAILGLYEDRSPDKFVESHLRKLRSYDKRLLAIQEVMKPDAKGDRLFWSKYAEHLYSEEDHPAIKALQKNIDELGKKYEKAKKARNKAESENDPNEEARHGRMIQTLGDLKKPLEEQKRPLEKGVELMQRGYQELLYPDDPEAKTKKPYRFIITIAQAHNNIKNLNIKELDTKELKTDTKPIPLDTIITDYNARNDAIEKLLNKIKDKKDAPRVTNDTFVWLQDTDLVRAHVDFLFKDSLEEAQRKDFIEQVNLIARKFTESLSVMDESLRVTLELIEHVNSKEAESIENAPLLTNVTIKLALSLIKIKSLHAAISNKHAPDDTLALREKLWGILPEEGKSKDSGWDKQRIKDYKDTLLLLFKEKPRTISSQLYNTHLFFIVGPYEDRDGNEENNKYKEAARRRFGIVLSRRQKNDKDEGDDIDEVLANFTGVARFRTGAGLDRGRLPEGLETLIDDYLILARDRSANPTDKQQEILEMKRTVLIEALVRFAEKVLVIANYDTLLRGNGDSKKNDKEKIEKYTDVLQAIGNSIIVMANELKMKASYSRKLDDGRRREIEAMEKVFSNDAPAGISRGSGSSKEVLDDLIALLRHEYVLKIKTFGKDSDQAKWAAEALDVLYKQRANMVYVRSASAYLRSSYPAASLQQDPAATGWENMLGRHAWRSVPFWREKAGNKSESDLKTLRDIDKQSWQNINHVRVAGTGDTSYVIVKDDIGNWYIKGYKGDPEPIIKGARNMALFAASAQTGQNLTNLKEASKSNSSSPEPPQIRQLRQYNTRYQKQLEKDYDKLKNVVNGLPSRIASLWDDSVSDTNEFKDELKKKALEIPQGRLLGVVDKVSAGKDTSFMEKYMDTLSAVVEYHNDIASALDNPALISEDGGWESSPKDRKSAVKTARKLMKDTLYDVLNRFIERREMASRDQETALMIIGDTGE